MCMGDRRSERSSGRRPSIAEEAFVDVTSFTSNLKKFIVGSGAFSAAACLLPIAAVFLAKERGRVQTTSVFFGDGATLVAPIVEKYNSTVVPYNIALRNEYFCDLSDTLSSETKVGAIIFWISAWGFHLVRAMTMFHPSLVGGTLCTIITLALITVCSVLHINEFKYTQQNSEHSSLDPETSLLPLMILFLPPPIYTISYAWSGRDKEKHTSLLKGVAPLQFKNTSVTRSSVDVGPWERTTRSAM